MGVVAGASEGHTADEAEQTPQTPEQTPQVTEHAPEQPQQAPGFGERGRMRRRARFLRRARELAYRDLGGLVFDLHRFGQRNDQLVLAKLAMLRQIDTELRELEQTLHDRRPVTVLREVGIAACPRCAAIHDSDDRFCPGCGLAFDTNADRPISTAPMAPQAHTPAPAAAAPIPPAVRPTAPAPTLPPAPVPTPPATSAPTPPATSVPTPPPSVDPVPATPAPPVKPTAAPVSAKPTSPEPPQPASSPSASPERGEPDRAPEDEPTQILRPPAPRK